jgi:hypothetical protein
MAEQQTATCREVASLVLHERWSTEAWPQVKAAFKKALALRSEIRRAGWFN